VPNPPPTPSCSNLAINTEAKILVAYSPGPGQSVGPGGAIKVWVADESPPIIAPGEIADPTTGAITTPGQRSLLAPDGYPWEPVLYINGKAYYPNAIKGDYNSASTTRGLPMLGGPVEPTPTGYVSPLPFTCEDIWDVSSLGLPPGTYAATFVVHDGDIDRGVGCVIIVIT
jgi:hypothetical protein